MEQAEALLRPKRVEVLRSFAEPRTCTQVGAELGESAQAVYYHVKRLQKPGLLELVDERRVRGIVEGIYQAVARSYWVAPELVGRLGPERSPADHLGLGYLLSLSESMQAELAGLAAGPAGLPSFGGSGEGRLHAGQGAAVVAGPQRALAGGAWGFGGGGPGAP